MQGGVDLQSTYPDLGPTTSPLPADEERCIQIDISPFKVSLAVLTLTDNMAATNDMADLYSKLAGDVDKAVDECLTEKPSEEEHSLGRQTRSMADAGGSDRNIALLVKEV